MARVVKDYAIRRNEILDAAKQLIFSKGYQQMTIQDILDTLHISKGAFYHYFDSKQNLLEALIERMVAEIMQVIEPLVADANLPAIEKFNQFIALTSNWKMERKDYLLEILRVWYADENALVRQKLLTCGYAMIAPILTHIITQGVREGVMHTAYPQQVSEVIYSLMYSIGEKIAAILLSSQPEDDDWPYLQAMTAAYTDAIEKALGTASGILNIYDVEILKQWVVPAATARLT